MEREEGKTYWVGEGTEPTLEEMQEQQRKYFEQPVLYPPTLKYWKSLRGFPRKHSPSSTPITVVVSPEDEQVPVD